MEENSNKKNGKPEEQVNGEINENEEELLQNTEEVHLQFIESESKESSGDKSQPLTSSLIKPEADLPSFSEDIINNFPTIARLYDLDEERAQQLLDELKAFNGFGLTVTGTKNNKKFVTNPDDINAKRSTISKADVEVDAVDKIIASYQDELADVQKQDELFDIFGVTKGRVNDKLINLFESHQERIGGIFINKFFHLNGHFPNHLEDNKRNILKAVTPYLLAGMENQNFSDLSIIGGKNLGAGMRLTRFKALYGSENTLAYATNVNGKKVFGTDRTLQDATLSEFDLVVGGFESLNSAQSINMEKVYLGDHSAINSERLFISELVFAGQCGFSEARQALIKKAGILGEYSFQKSYQTDIGELYYKVLPDNFGVESVQMRLVNRNNSITKSAGFMKGATNASVDMKLISGLTQAFNKNKSSTNDLYKAQKGDALEKFREELYTLPKEADSTQYKLH